MSESLAMESPFRGPLAPGYYDIIHLTANKLAISPETKNP